MYCKRCGKYIESGDICPECASEEVVFGGEVKVEQYEEKIPSRKTGLERAIVGAALAVFAAIFSAIGIIFTGLKVAFDWMPQVASGEVMIIPIALFLMGAGVMTVFGAVFGIRSVILAFHDRRETGKLPIATMILGFVAIACAVIAVFLVLYAMTITFIFAAVRI